LDQRDYRSPQMARAGAKGSSRRMTRRFTRGLVVGKFSPLHRGHGLLIDAAMAACDHVVIISYCSPTWPGCEASRRQRWLTALYPHATVLVPSDGLAPPNDAPADVHRDFCARLLFDDLNTTIDAVFTSEGHGAGFADALTSALRLRDPAASVTHVCIDPRRATIPMSGTMLREDVHRHRHWMPAEVYADFVERVCFLGAESTGKTSICAALADAHDTVWVHEFGRELWEDKNGALDFDDYRTIVDTQIAREEAALQRAKRYVFCDTSPLTTLFYQLEQFGQSDEAVERAADRRYHRTFLCAPDFPMVQDGWRQDEAFRSGQHEWYHEQLARRGVAFEVLTGGLAARVAQVERALLVPLP
jgi:HTH-type transcriptional repressor of NAD biosynthesis genes